MMMASEFTCGEINFDDSKITSLIVENRVLFRKIISSFLDDSIDELITFSKDFKPFAFSKTGIFIQSPIDVSFSSKKLQNKINSRLAELSSAYLADDITDVKSSLFRLADELVKISDFEVDYNSDLDIPDIIKFLDFNVDGAGLSICERFISFVTIVSKYLGTSLFAVQNLHLYFSKEELSAIYETVLLNHITLIAIDCVSFGEISDCENQIVIDNDLCRIDRGRNP